MQWALAQRYRVRVALRELDWMPFRECGVGCFFASVGISLKSGSFDGGGLEGAIPPLPSLPIRTRNASATLWRIGRTAMAPPLIPATQHK